MADPIVFDRKPYFVTWKDQDGNMQTIRRVPPPKLHDALPPYVVELTADRSADFRKGDQVTVKHINPRHPNVLQVEDGDGHTTFMNYFEVNLKEQVAMRDGVPPEARPERNKYLTWP